MALVAPAWMLVWIRGFGVQVAWVLAQAVAQAKGACEMAAAVGRGSV